MPKTALVFAHRGHVAADNELPVPELRRYLQGWLLEGQIQNLTASTLETRRLYVRLPSGS